jgi:hypothetical protein
MESRMRFVHEIDGARQELVERRSRRREPIQFVADFRPAERGSRHRRPSKEEPLYARGDDPT